ncbi:hypothetical protein BDN72DRAFT_839851 [Pluteus cervinus]|uniref:Uncharacterized protein n=1 Tax=Pluteus cervinus TaxID=181527 RepID=A0ACD3AVB0_9AGAR|nr:hypothetical protein BDN72DRAFT_839851 [Pluteus cervinus]
MKYCAVQHSDCGTGTFRVGALFNESPRTLSSARGKTLRLGTATGPSSFCTSTCQPVRFPPSLIHTTRRWRTPWDDDSGYLPRRVDTVKWMTSLLVLGNDEILPLPSPGALHTGAWIQADNTNDGLYRLQSLHPVCNAECATNVCAINQS